MSRLTNPIVTVSYYDRVKINRKKSRNNGLLRIIYFNFYVYISCFYIAYSSNAAISGIFLSIKWVPLFTLIFLLLFSFTRMRYPIGGGGLTILLWLFLSFAAASTLLMSSSEGSVFVFASLILTLLASLLLAGHARQSFQEERLFDVIANVGRVVIAISVAMAFLNLNFGRGIDRFSGWTDNPNSLGLIIAPIIIILSARIIERRRGWIYLYAPFVIAGIYVLHLTGSRASIGWVAMSIVAFFVARKGIGLLGFAAIFGVPIIIAYGDTAVTYIVESISRGHTSRLESAGFLSGRVEVWDLAISLWRENPWFGFGIGSSEPLLSAYAYFFEVHQGLHFHSSYITTLVETGLLGSFFFFTILITALFRGFLRGRRLWQTAPPHRWPTLALPWIIFVGALAHASVESWLLSAGNANTLMFWVVVAFCFERPRQFSIQTAGHNSHGFEL